jgi:regulator of sigma E protease
MDYCLIAAATFSWTSWQSWWAIAQMALGLGAVIFVHELGHFLVAKACGVKCEKFYLGFDAFDIKIGKHVIVPRSLLKWTWGETQYGVGILPLGGYVKMLGQDDNPSNIANERKRSESETHDVSAGDLDLESTAVGPIDRSKLDPRSYQAKTVPQRMAIISAGVIMNLIFSVIFATIAFQTGVNYEPAVIGQTVPGSPAYVADLDGAEIVAVNGRSTVGTYYIPQPRNGIGGDGLQASDTHAENQPRFSRHRLDRRVASGNQQAGRGRSVARASRFASGTAFPKR